jgi:DNA-binding CsgD family transcriptional regulator
MVSALMLLGPFSFFSTLLFRPAVLTAYASGDPLLLTPVSSAQATIAAMLFAGIACLTVLPRIPRCAVRVLLVVTVVAACGLAGVITFVHALAVPIVASVVLGVVGIIQIYLFAHYNSLDTTGTLLGTGLSLAIAAVLSHLLFSVTAIHAFGNACLALLAVASSVLILQQKDRGSSGQSGCSTEEVASLGTILRGSLITGIPILLESLLAALSLGFSWNRAVFGVVGANSLFFAVGIVLGLGFVLALLWSWTKYAHADFLVFGAAFPVALALALSLADFGAAAPLLYVLAVLSEFCFLILSWSSALLLDKAPTGGGRITVFYLLVFVVAFGLSMSLANLMSEPLSQKFFSLVALAFLLYLLVYSLKTRRQPIGTVTTEADTEIGTEIGGSTNVTNMTELMRSKCAILAQDSGLSPREAELLPFLVVGMSGTAIGRRMFISPETVKTHRYRVYRKIGVSSHEELYDLFTRIGDAED